MQNAAPSFLDQAGSLSNAVMAVGCIFAGLVAVAIGLGFYVLNRNRL